MTMSDERIHIGKMLDISDEDAAEVIKDVAVSVTAHPRMSGVVRELAAKYGKKAILAGMMLAKTFEANEDVQGFGSGVGLTDMKNRAHHAADGEADDFGEGEDGNHD